MIMIIERAHVSQYLDLVDADCDGFMLDNTDGQQVWLSYEQLDAIVALLAPIRKFNEEAE